MSYAISIQCNCKEQLGVIHLIENVFSTPRISKLCAVQWHCLGVIVRLGARGYSEEVKRQVSFWSSVVQWFRKLVAY